MNKPAADQQTKPKPDLAARSRYPAGTIVFEEGEADQSAYLVVSGKVDIQVSKGSKKVIVSSLGPGQIFGDYALVDNSPRSATAVVVEPTEVVVVSKQMIQNKLKGADPFLVAWIEVLVDRIRGLNRRLHGDG